MVVQARLALVLLLAVALTGALLKTGKTYESSKQGFTRLTKFVRREAEVPLRETGNAFEPSSSNTLKHPNLSLENQVRAPPEEENNSQKSNRKTQAAPERFQSAFFKLLRFGAARRTLETPITSRATFFINLANYNAICHYHETAVDIFGRRYFPEGTRIDDLGRRNTAAYYAILRLLEASPTSFGEPTGAAGIRDFMLNVEGLDPDDMSLDTTTDVGIGNSAGIDTARLMAMDGFNAFGNLTTSADNYKKPFEDYTGYTPKNTPWELEYPFRWQPVLESSGFGFFFRQEHVVPQAGKALTFSISPQEIKENREKVEEPYPKAIDKRKGQVKRKNKDFLRLKRDAERILSISKNLNETQMILAEFFDGKVGSFEIPEDPAGFVRGIAPALRFSVVGGTLDHSAEEDAFFGLGATMIAYESIVASWNAKVHFDAVRPTGQTMEWLLGDDDVDVFGGPYQESVTIKPRDWIPYLRTMPHSEYPSGSACLCLTSVEHAREALIEKQGNDAVPPYTIAIKKGRSKFYRGVVPRDDFEYSITNLDDWSNICGESRLWAGVHFPPAVEAGRKLCKNMGVQAHKFVNDLVAGNVNKKWMDQVPKRDRFWESTEEENE